MARAVVIGSGSARQLGGSWALAAVAPGRAHAPADLETLAPEWIVCDGPMPVAAALRAAGRCTVARDFDADEWWYRCRFAAPDAGERPRLHFEGLATVADAWLNGTHILRSESMFIATAIEVGDVLRSDNELVLRFHALVQLLASPRPRPKWRTRLVAHQQLRWHRTALLGRIPAWCPPLAPVGPWRPVLVESAGSLLVEEADVRADLNGDDGLVRVSIPATRAAANARDGGTLFVGKWTAPVAFEHSSDGKVALRGIVRVPQVERWWPHTHGRQALYAVKLSVDINGEAVRIDLGRVGFRALEVDRGADGEGFGLIVNGVAMFCRGACWTPLDLARLDADSADYRTALERLRDAGMNMLRVSGTMVYETDDLPELLRRTGILVWQDFMFANMDYPVRRHRFDAAVTLEAQQLLRRLQARPSLAVLCGGSEVEQQAAMLGCRASAAASALRRLAPALVRSFCPECPVPASTPSGGCVSVPANRGVTSLLRGGRLSRAARRRAPFGGALRRRVPRLCQHPRRRNAGTDSRRQCCACHHPRWKARCRATRRPVGISMTCATTMCVAFESSRPTCDADMDRYLVLAAWRR